MNTKPEIIRPEPQVMEDGSIFYPFSNKTMFAYVMQDADICKQFLEMIMPGRKIKELKYIEKAWEESATKEEKSETEVIITNTLHNKSVRLDVLFEEEKVYHNIEMQTTYEAALGKRARFYQASVDVKDLKKGQDILYDKLKDSYVIFICMYDPYGCDKPLYRYISLEENLGLKLDDGRYTMILNIACSPENIPEPWREFFEYVRTGKFVEGSNLVKEIHKRVEAANHDGEVRRAMTVEEQLKIEHRNGVYYGRMEAMWDVARKMKEDGIDSEMIVKYTGLPIEEIEKL